MRNLFTTIIVLTVFLLPHYSIGLKNDQGFSFTISGYNLIFTEVEIDNRKYTALIDFGDFAPMQLSGRLIAELDLPTEKSDIKMMDVQGNEYFLQQGKLSSVTIDNYIASDITFYSAAGEIEQVSEQVGTGFDVVIGFGFFRNRKFRLDFKEQNVSFSATSSQKGAVIPVNTDYGYLIMELSEAGEHLLFDTGAPISQISDKHQLASRDSSIHWQNHTFPSKYIKFSTQTAAISINAETMDISSIASLGVQGILGINDMLGKVFIYDPENSTLQVIE